MSDPSQSESNPKNEVQTDAQNSEGTMPETEEAQAVELSAEELDEVAGAGLIYITTGTTTTTVSPTPPPPPTSPPPRPTTFTP